MRDIVILACDKCKRHNYTTTKNRRRTSDKFSFKKYCRFCRQHIVHNETRVR